jgi:aryl-alcohol dehydrogenase-like predicted oxidoreductase
VTAERPVGSVRLGDRGPTVSRFALGTSPFGGVFGPVDEGVAIAAAHAALAAGITYFDTAPAYGATRSEQVLGTALRGVPRTAYVVSTKAGKTTDDRGVDRLAFDERSIRASVDASSERLGVERIDVVFLHDFDLEDGRHLGPALDTGLGTLRALQAEGRVGAVGAGIYRMDVWKRVLRSASIDVALVHNHHTLLDLRAHELAPLAAAKGVGIVNGAPFASGLLTGRPAPAWHPASARARRLLARAARLTDAAGVPLARLALAFAAADARFPVTLFGAGTAEEVRRNLDWLAASPDPALVAEVQELLEPLMGRQWRYRMAGAPAVERHPAPKGQPAPKGPA